MSDEDELMRLSEAMAEWEDKLPENHAGRTLLAGLRAMDENLLEHRTIEGPEDAAGTVWQAILTLGTVADGALKYFLYPAPQTADDLRDRDRLMEAIMARPEAVNDPRRLLNRLKDSSTTYAMAYLGTLDGVRVWSIAWHPELAFHQAVSLLKLVVGYVRKGEAAAAEGDS